MKDMTWLRNDFIAHRGLYHKDQSIPENSLAAFKNAIENGYSIELDINVLKDHTIVVYHDINLKRLCQVDKQLNEVTYQDIKDLKIMSTDQKIPTLREVLRLVNGRVPLLIEFKPSSHVETICNSFIQDIKDYQGDYAIFSFHPRVVYWFKKNHPQIIRGQISEYFKHQKLNFISKWLLKTMFFNYWTKPDFISYGIHDLPNKYLDSMYKKGRTIISYAAKTQEQFDCVRNHYHNVVFEYFEPKK